MARSTTHPPAATRSNASSNSSTRPTRSFIRYPARSGCSSMRRSAYARLEVLREDEYGRPGRARADLWAARSPSSVCVGGIRTSTSATSGRRSRTHASSASASPTWATTSTPFSVSRRVTPSRMSGASSAITTRMGALRGPLFPGRPAVDRERRVERIQSIAQAGQSGAGGDSGSPTPSSVTVTRSTPDSRTSVTDASVGDACFVTLVSASETTK